MHFTDAYAARTPVTKALYERAKRTIPGGAGSTARLPRNGWKPYPIVMAHGSGSRLTDVDGNTYIDYLLGLGPMILGHRHPVVTGAVTEAIRDLGTCFGLPYELEIEAAEKVVAAVPGIEQVRFTNSGSEAVGTAVRLARATTGRRIVVRFEGHYHGWQDTVYWSNHVDPELAGPADHPRPVAMGPGVPAELEDTLVVLTWNDPDSFVDLMNRRGDEIAAVLTEPAVFNTGCILPEPGYLELLRSETRKHGALLIFDEVITGFRFARGGAQEWFGVTPDLTTLAKGLGGGFPVAAVGGSTEAMHLVAEGVYSHSGTYNANVVQCAAVSATMDLLAEPGLYERQRALGHRLAAGLGELAAERGLDAYCEGLGTVFQLWFADGPIHNWRDAVSHADEALFTRWYEEMVIRGVLFHPLQFENLFVSLVHDDRDIDETLQAAADALTVVARTRTPASRS
ncbi:glutamate-1-semialdehyde 2,1-aminomutase [Mycolicibacterium aromaticivorans JS19b1 = JCM 16368]|uniref:Glutamate-1-semialdehyde 2,1-aminomutase n=1 Tax=Mycolicibacterium aromaticivorans JS19b1 = JCM 16368 TaxID=1440774 RepID=A0A064CFN3_9MYCO|nr:aspartate aminotransferase family protein [Mycolicibacterium aromaticivorans]KDE97548.1 glutamate-1-semialdehyde 2,1-aminomutase [Mycolicibacterium aromaticivorans JS19b1 = JCM 16368]